MFFYEITNKFLNLEMCSWRFRLGKFDLLVSILNISTLCYFILALHISSEGNSVFYSWILMTGKFNLKIFTDMH